MEPSNLTEPVVPELTGCSSSDVGKKAGRSVSLAMNSGMSVLDNLIFRYLLSFIYKINKKEI